MVAVGGKQAVVEASDTGTRVVAYVPVGATPGVQDVVVTSAIPRTGSRPRRCPAPTSSCRP
jgi:hypothetical protein